MKRHLFSLFYDHDGKLFYGQVGMTSISNAIIWYIYMIFTHLVYIVFELCMLEKKKEGEQYIEIFKFDFLELDKG